MDFVFALGFVMGAFVATIMSLIGMFLIDDTEIKKAIDEKVANKIRGL